MIRAINVWAIGVVRHRAVILDWSDQELRAMDVKRRRRMTMFAEFHKNGSVAGCTSRGRMGKEGIDQCVGFCERGGTWPCLSK